MDTCSNCGAEAGDLAFCTRCGASLTGGAPSAESPTTVLAATKGEAADASLETVGASQAQQEQSTAKDRKISRKGLWLLVASVLVIAGGAAALLLVRNAQEADARAAAVASAATTVSDTMTELSAARTTADMRAVAAKAKEQQPVVWANAEFDPSIAAAAEALGAIAALDSINGDTLSTWPNHRVQINNAVKGIRIDGAAMDPGEVLSAVDTTVANAQAALDKWTLEVSVIKETQEKRAAELNAYEPGGRAAVESYKNLRDSTAEWLADAQKASSISVSSTTSYLQRARDDREDIRDALTALDPPPELQSMHDEIVTSLGLGIDGIESLLDGMSALSGCSGTRCTLSRNSGYSAFLSASSANTARFDRAYDEWEATVAGLRAEIEGMQVQTKPVV